MIKDLIIGKTYKIKVINFNLPGSWGVTTGGIYDAEHTMVYVNGDPEFAVDTPGYSRVYLSLESDECRCELVETKTSVLKEVAAERASQEAKWGEQNHSPAEWLMILGEEVGEVNKAALEVHFKYDKDSAKDYKSYRAELIQVAAVAVAMVESLDRNGK